MPTTPRSQSALALDPNFQKRVGPLLIGQAIVVANEDPTTPGHMQRRDLAQRILTNSAYMTPALTPTIANGTNLVAANTTYNFEAFAVETSANDAEILSQIASLWDVMAGVIPEVEPVP
jgi:hypothetical protein